MQIQITLNQADIEAAIRDHLVKVGMTSPVDDINFTVSRKGGQTIEASIDMSPDGSVPAPKVADQTEPKTGADPKTTKSVSKAKAESEPAPEKAEEKAPEPEAKAEEPAPWEPEKSAEASNDTDTSDDAGDGAIPANKKSLFG